MFQGYCIDGATVDETPALYAVPYIFVAHERGAHACRHPLGAFHNIHPGKSSHILHPISQIRAMDIPAPPRPHTLLSCRKSVLITGHIYTTLCLKHLPLKKLFEAIYSLDVTTIVTVRIPHRIPLSRDRHDTPSFLQDRNGSVISFPATAAQFTFDGPVQRRMTPRILCIHISTGLD